ALWTLQQPSIHNNGRLAVSSQRRRGRRDLFYKTFSARALRVSATAQNYAEHTVAVLSGVRFRGRKRKGRAGAPAGRRADDRRGASLSQQSGRLRRLAALGCASPLVRGWP